MQYLTATDLGGYFHLSCQLSLWKTYHEGHQKGAGMTKIAPRTKATFFRGNEWENLLVKRLEANDLILRLRSNDSLVDSVLSEAREHFYVVGAAFKKPDLFAKEFAARGTRSVSFGLFKPDFIEVRKRVGEKTTVEWHVIDAKSSKQVKV
jgi:hypothetical protein